MFNSRRLHQIIDTTGESKFSQQSAHLYPLLLSPLASELASGGAEGMKMGFSVSSGQSQNTPPTKRRNPAQGQRLAKFSNTYQSPSGYFFRMRVPNDLELILGKGEFRYSLRTGSLLGAKLRTRSIAAYIQQLFMRLRSNMAELTQDQINQLIRQYIRETLSNDEQCREIANPSTTGMTTLEGKSILESSDMSAEEAQSILTSVERWIRNQNHTLMEPVADTVCLRVFRRRAPPIKSSSESYSRRST